MGLVTSYNNDIFISYSHIDNQSFGDPGGGWVDIFHEHLQNFVNVHVGRRTSVWRDKRLTGTEVFAGEIEQQLRSSAVLISVISPGYMQSEWCNRELVGFTRYAEDHGNLRVGNLQRVVKVLRLPVDRSVLPPLLDDVLGAQFYRVDPASGRARDLLLDPGADALQVFRARVDDVAQDLSRLLEAMAASGNAAAAPPPVSTGDSVFLAWTTGDLSEEREQLRRELEARGYRVVPAGAPPLDAAGVRERVLASLRDARVAVHLIGAHYGFVRRIGRTFRFIGFVVFSYFARFTRCRFLVDSFDLLNRLNSKLGSLEFEARFVYLFGKLLGHCLVRIHRLFGFLYDGCLVQVRVGRRPGPFLFVFVFPLLRLS